MKVLELFSGTGSFSKVAKERGHEVFTVDIEAKFKPDLCINVLELTPEIIIHHFGYPDVIWASPPCTTFSVASISRYWDKGQPKNTKTLEGIEIVKKTISLIEALNPKFWVIENPRGMLRKQSFMPNQLRKTVTYCQYNSETMKPTDLWSNLISWDSKPMCSPNSPCHIRSPRGSKQGIQGVIGFRRGGNHPDWSYAKSTSAIRRAVVPKALCEEILTFCEHSNTQPTKENLSNGSQKIEKANI